jgi:DNA-binding transcriptional LysR family regulator
MTHKLDDYYIFCQVVKLGSMKAASEALEIPLSTVSRRISSLEERVSSPLFIRSKTALKPTNTGILYYDRLSVHFNTLVSELDTINSDLDEVSGKVSVCCTDFVYQHFLKRSVEQILTKYPKLKLKFIPSRDLTTFHPDADLAILAGELPDSNIVVKRLNSSKLQVFAAPTFAAEPKTLNGLKELDFIGHLQQQHVTGYNRDSQMLETVHLYPKLSVFEPLSVVEMACNGVGFAFIPTYLAKDAFKSGDLVEWFSDYDFGHRETYLAYRHRTQKTKAQQVVMSMIEERFAQFEKE